MCKTCENRMKEILSLEGRLTEERKLTKYFRETVEMLKKKPSVEGLLSIASAAAQTAKLSAGAFPEGDSVADEAGRLALTALEQVRERLKDGDKNAGS